MGHPWASFWRSLGHPGRTGAHLEIQKVRKKHAEPKADGKLGKGNGDFVPGPKPAAKIAQWKAQNKYKQRFTQAERAERVAVKKAAYSARLGGISQGAPLHEDDE